MQSSAYGPPDSPYCGDAGSVKATRKLDKARRRAEEGCPPEGYDIKGEVLEPARPASAGTTEIDNPVYGICLSGGGIRSASFCLGVLQQMGKTAVGESGLDVLSGARYLTAVSGGGYMAGAHAMVNAGAFPGEPPDPRTSLQGDMTPVVPSASMAAFAPGSPEESYLRNRTRYLTHGWGGPVGAIWRLIVGIAWNLLILTLGLGVIFIPVGWIYGAQVPSLRAGCAQGCTPHHFAFPAWSFQVALAAALAGVFVGMLWVSRNWGREGVRRVFLGVSLGLLASAMAWLLFGMGLPWLLGWVQRSAAHHAANKVASAGSTTGSVAAVGAGGIVVSVLVALFGTRVLRTGEWAWHELSPDQQKGVRKTIANGLKTVWARIRLPVLNLLASLIAPVTVALIAFLWVHIGSLYPIELRRSDTVTILWIAGLVLLALIWSVGDLTAWSMHPFYRERLSAAFVLKRFKMQSAPWAGDPHTRWSPTAKDDDGDCVDATRRRYDIEYPLSDALRYPNVATPASERSTLAMADAMGVPRRLFPELVLCGSANVSQYGATPTDSRVASFVFSRDAVGSPLLGSWSAPAYEHAIWNMPRLRRNVTLPAAVAICGAAISPEMGRMTIAPLRFLLTMLNIRLGVWLPNPNRLQEFSIRQRSRWARLWMVPRLPYLLREMAGKDDPKSKFIYVTDGGHYENLGLVELLRRRPGYVWCIDASGEKQDSFSTIAGAVALAYSELGIRIHIDPGADMAPDATTTKARTAAGLKPVVKSTFSVGTIEYPGGAEPGRIVIIKTGVPADAPLDVSDFYENDKKAFPCDPTLDQLYTADRFDAYRSLGAFAADAALAHCREDFSQFLLRNQVPPTFVAGPSGLTRVELGQLNPSADVQVGIAIGHDEPPESAAIGELLESLAVLHVLLQEGLETRSVYLDPAIGRLRLSGSIDGLIPPTPQVTEADANFSVDLSTVADVAVIVDAVAAVVSPILHRITDRRERRAAAGLAARQAALHQDASSSSILATLEEQLGRDFTVNGIANGVTINVILPPHSQEGGPSSPH